MTATDITTAEFTKATSDLIDDLVEVRLNLCITQAEVARTMGTSAPAVNHYEHHRREPGLKWLIRYADAIGADITFVMRRSG